MEIQFCAMYAKINQSGNEKIHSNLPLPFAITIQSKASKYEIIFILEHSLSLSTSLNIMR